MLTLPSILTACLSTAVATCDLPGTGQGNPIPAQPNILVIVLDDVGRDQLEMYADTFPNGPTSFQPTPFDCEPSPFTPAPLPYAKTPNLERLADGQVNGGGIRFDRMFVNPLCSASRSCFLTGRYSFRTGIGVLAAGPGEAELPNSEVLISELLKNGFTPGGPLSQYKSGAFGKWHLTSVQTPPASGVLNYAHAVQNGFDVFQGVMANVGTNVTDPGDHYNFKWVSSTPASTTTTQISVSGGCTDLSACQTLCGTPEPTAEPCCYNEDNWNASLTRKAAMSWINDQTQPFFAYVCFNPPHFPMQLPPFSLLSCETRGTLTAAAVQHSTNCGAPFRPGEHWNDPRFYPGPSNCPTTGLCHMMRRAIFYNAMLEAVDTEIGLLIDGIHENKLANTMIIVVSDNGTPQDIVAPPFNATHGKGSQYELGTRVPLIVSGPLVPTTPQPAHTCDELVSAVDLFRTVAQMANASVSLAAPLSPLDSKSFKNLIMNPSATGNRTQALTQSFFPPRPYEPTSFALYVPDPSCDVDPAPNHCCVVRSYNAGHGRALTIGQFRYFRIQSTVALDGGGCATDTPATYTEQLYDLSLHPDEDCDIMNPACADYDPVHPMLATFRTAMTNLAGN